MTRIEIDRSAKIFLSIISGCLLWLCVDKEFANTGLGSGRISSQTSNASLLASFLTKAPHQDKIEAIEGLPEGYAIEFGTATVEAKWQRDQTKGVASVSFKRPFIEPPVVVANQFGQGGWHFFVHATSTKDRASFSVVLDRWDRGEPKLHECHLSFVAIGRVE